MGVKKCVKLWARSGGEDHLQQRDLDSQKHYNKLSKRQHYHTFVGIRLR